MKAEGLKFFTDIHLTVAGLVIFVSVFAASVWFVCRKDKQNYFKKMQDAPLQD
jgi:hypothetical protein